MTAFRQIFLITCLVALAGCGASSEDELQQWMAEQKNQTRPKVVAISEPKQFLPESYNQVGTTEPFSNQKLTEALKRESTQSAASGALIAPELARRKEALESYPLDTMVMVGRVVKAGKSIALVKVDNFLYQVRPGDHLGQYYGRVTTITETEITLREIVQDAAGEWIERTATLQLQEGSK